MFDVMIFVYFQLSTGTGVISQFVNLNVVAPQAVILGNNDYHVELGSTIQLTCLIEQVSIQSDNQIYFEKYCLVFFSRKLM